MKLEKSWLQVLENLRRVILLRNSLQPCHVAWTIPSDDGLITTAVWHIIVIVVYTKLLSHGSGHLNIVLSSLHHRSVVARLVPSHIHQNMEKRSVLRVETEGVPTVPLHSFQRRFGERLKGDVDGHGWESRCDFEKVVGHLLDELSAHLEGYRPHGRAEPRWHVVASVGCQILERAVAGVVLHEWNAQVLSRDLGRICEVDWDEVFEFGKSELVRTVLSHKFVRAKRTDRTTT